MISNIRHGELGQNVEFWVERMERPPGETFPPHQLAYDMAQNISGGAKKWIAIIN
jgi:hypothetical protein